MLQRREAKSCVSSFQIVNKQPILVIFLCLVRLSPLNSHKELTLRISDAISQGSVRSLSSPVCDGKPEASGPVQRQESFY